MKKKLLIIISILLFIIILLIYTYKLNNKFYLTKKYYDNYQYKVINHKKVEKMISNNDSFVLFTNNDFCIFKVPCDNIFKSVFKDSNMTLFYIRFDEFKKTSLYKKVNYAPSVLLINNGQLITYLDPDSDSDSKVYQSKKEFRKWLEKYIYLNEKDNLK